MDPMLSQGGGRRVKTTRGPCHCLEARRLRGGGYSINKQRTIGKEATRKSRDKTAGNRLADANRTLGKATSISTLGPAWHPGISIGNNDGRLRYIVLYIPRLNVNVVTESKRTRMLLISLLLHADNGLANDSQFPSVHCVIWTNVISSLELQGQVDSVDMEFAVGHTVRYHSPAEAPEEPLISSMPFPAGHFGSHSILLPTCVRSRDVHHPAAFPQRLLPRA